MLVSKESFNGCFIHVWAWKLKTQIYKPYTHAFHNDNVPGCIEYLPLLKQKVKQLRMNWEIRTIPTTHFFSRCHQTNIFFNKISPANILSEIHLCEDKEVNFYWNTVQMVFSKLLKTWKLGKIDQKRANFFEIYAILTGQLFLEMYLSVVFRMNPTWQTW